MQACVGFFFLRKKTKQKQKKRKFRIFLLRLRSLESLTLCSVKIQKINPTLSVCKLRVIKHNTQTLTSSLSLSLSHTHTNTHTLSLLFSSSFSKLTHTNKLSRRYVHSSWDRFDIFSRTLRYKKCERWTWPAKEDKESNAFSLILKLMQDEEERW